jgi:hypothetical protein
MLCRKLWVLRYVFPTVWAEHFWRCGQQDVCCGVVQLTPWCAMLCMSQPYMMQQLAGTCLVNPHNKVCLCFLMTIVPCLLEYLQKQLFFMLPCDLVLV